MIKDLPDDANTAPDKMYAGFICSVCGLDSWFKIRAKFDNEDLMHYVNHVGKEAGISHGLLSIVCTPKTLSLKLPMTAEGIGIPGRALTKEEQEELSKKYGG